MSRNDKVWDAPAERWVTREERAFLVEARKARKQLKTLNSPYR